MVVPRRSYPRTLTLVLARSCDGRSETYLAPNGDGRTSDDGCANEMFAQ
jgi:hypothetical protein